VKHRATAAFKNTFHEQSPFADTGDGAALSRIHIERELTGDLVGKTTAELQACQAAPDRFAYVGTDRFTGRLKDRPGSFVFQHGGIHEKGTLHPFGYVVPGSGTQELKGLVGEIKIAVTPAGEHTLELNYDFE
jgi:hypothetical protein